MRWHHSHPSYSRSYEDSIIPTRSSSPLPCWPGFQMFPPAFLYLSFFFSSHMDSRQEMPRNALFNALHPQQLSTNNWWCFINSRAPASFGWENSEALFKVILKTSPGGFGCHCPRDNVVDKTPLVGFSPPCLTHYSSRDSWDYLPNKLLSSNSYLRVCFWSNQTEREAVRGHLSYSNLLPTLFPS